MMKRKLKIIGVMSLIIALLAFVGTSGNILSFAEGEDVKVSLEVQGSSGYYIDDLNLNDEIDVEVWIEPLQGVPEVNLVQGFVTYDTSVFEFVSYSDIHTSFYCDLNSSEEGNIMVSLQVLGNLNISLDSKIQLITIKLKVISEPSSNTQINYDFSLDVDGVFNLDQGSYTFAEISSVVVPLSYNQPATYTVEYDINGGTSGTTADSVHVYDTPKDLTLNGYVKTGFAFAGWSTSSGGAVAYADGESVVNLSAIDGDTVTLYAVWSANTYTIQYNGNESTGGATSPSNHTYDQSEVLTSNGFTRTGYTFAGWATSAAGAVVYSDGQSVSNLTSTQGATVSLYAKWTPISYTISYNGNGSTSGSTATSSHTYDTSKTLTANGFLRTGYSFAGWATSSEGAVVYSNSESILNLSSVQGDVITLYAKWDIVTYTIEYNGNGATSGSTASSIHTYNISMELTPNSYSRVGYSFQGWSTSEGGAVDYTNGQSVVNLTLTQGAIFTLYAVWTANTYTIEYNGNGSTSGSMVSSNHTYDVAKDLSEIAYINTGNDFLGWAYSSGGAIEFIDKQSVSNLTAIQGDVITLYAIWGIKQYTLTFISNGGSSVSPMSRDYGEAISSPATLRTGYEFKGWFRDNSTFLNEFVFTTMPDESVELYAKWQLQTYNITYFLNSGVNNPSNLATYTILSDTFSILNPSRVGHEFLGWFSDEALTLPAATTISQGSTGHRNYYAKWTIGQYTISFVSNGGTAVASIQEYYNQPISAPSSPTRTGYTFDKWYSDVGLINEYTFDLMPPNNTTLYAGWNINQYTIQFAANGGSATSPITQDYNTALVEPTHPTRQGYEFKGWYFDDEIFEQQFTFSTMPAQNITLYANWDIVLYTITFNSKGGSAVAPISESFNTAIEEPAPPTRVGYNFGGWYLEEEYITAYTFNTMPLDNITLYAKWNIIVYSITYHLDGGNLDPKPANYTVVSDTFTIGVPFRSGLTFGGWFSDTALEIPAQTTISTGSTGNRVFYVKWIETEHMITFNSNGGTTVNTIYATYNSDISQPENPTRLGFNFVSWCTDFELIHEYTFNTMPDYSFSLYAKWQIIEYDIVYNLDGGVNHPSNPSSYNVLSSNIIIESPSRGGYDFDGWYSDGGLSVPANLVISTGSTGQYVYYAKWILKEYTIEYRLGGGDNHLDNLTTYNLFTPIFEFKDPTREGYVFEGWFSDMSRTIPAINPINPQVVMSDMIVYAKWSQQVYTITYYYYGGIRNPQNPETYTISSPTINITGSMKMGYTFGGWYHNESLTIVANNTIPSGSMGDRVYHAKWIIDEYSITYHMDGGYNDVNNPTSYNIASETIVIETPSKNGYEFLGWYKDSSFTSTQSATISSGSTGNRVYYAKWALINYSINYHLDGGINHVNNYLVYNVNSPTFNIMAPSKAGHLFKGWFLDSELTISAPTTIGTGSTGDLTYYALWELNDYNIRYYLYGGANNSSNPNTYNVNSSTIVLQSPTRLGYTFVGWYDDPSYSNEVITINSGSHGNINLFARWTKDLYQITYYLDSGVNHIYNPNSYSVDSPTLIIYSPAREGYSFEGWFRDSNYIESAGTLIASGSTGDVNYYAKWSIRMYEITYHLNGGFNSDDNPYIYYFSSGDLTIHDPLRTGYGFAGWFYDSSFTEPAPSTIPSGSSGDLNYYAKWILVDYTIIYHLYGGDNNPFNRSSYNYTTQSFVIGDPQYDSYAFGGWFYESEFTQPANTVIHSGSVGDIELFAKWNLNSFSITYYLYGGVNNPSNLNTYTDSTPTFEILNPTRDGFIFSGWYNDSSYTTLSNTTISEGSEGNRAFHAKWDIISYNINYYLDSGVNHLFNPDNYNIQSIDFNIYEPTKTGYTFLGWFNDPEFNQSANTYIPRGTMGNIDLYALWTIKQYSLIYELNGGENNISNISSYNIDTETFNIYDPTKFGYNFLGWYSDAVFNNLAITTIEKGSYGDLNYYAKWQAISYDIIYYLNDGNNNENNPNSYTIEDSFILLNPERVGYSFAGWYIDAELEVEAIINIDPGTTSNLEFYAKWEIITYTIAYIVGDGINSPENIESYTVISDTFILFEATKPGYQFAGWYYDEEYTQPAETTINTGSIGDITIYALFVEISKMILAENSIIGGESVPQIHNLATFNGLNPTIVNSRDEEEGKTVYLIGTFINERVADVKNSFVNGHQLKVYNAGNVEMSDTAAVGTGYRIRLLDDNNNIVDEVVIVIIGDVRGDARIRPFDILRLGQHLSGHSALTDAFLIAGDVRGDRRIRPFDILRLGQHLSGHNPL